MSTESFEIEHVAEVPHAMPVTDRRFAERWLLRRQAWLDDLGARTGGARARAERRLARRAGGGR